MTQSVIGMVWYGMVWRSNHTIPAAYIITGMVLPVRPTIPPRLPRQPRICSKRKLYALHYWAINLIVINLDILAIPVMREQVMM